MYYIKHIQRIGGLMVALTAMLLAGAASAKTFDMPASSQGYNRIVLPSPYAKVVIPPQAPLAERPLPLSNKKGLLLKPKAGAGAIPVFIELKTGESFTVQMKTDDELEDGQVFRYRGATDKQDAPASVNRVSDQFIADTIKSAMEGSEPVGMGEVRQPKTIKIRIDKRQTACRCKTTLVLVPKAAYRGSQHKVSVYRMYSDNLLEVDPRDFWREGVTAVATEGDVVGPKQFPMIVIMEADNER